MEEMGTTWNNNALPARLLLKGIELRGGHPVENYIHGAERRQTKLWLTHLEVMRNSVSKMCLLKK